jgi:hypothetical protein
VDKLEARKASSGNNIKTCGANAAQAQGADKSPEFIIRELRKATVQATDVDDDDFIPDL